ncbi:putative hemolysin [Alysiella crassa]|uniref:Hemolysin n=1 Tax=Alysiella crassa TaxID=153491 RepID=A0A376BWG3_9NEIS|nr:DUF333 domain-containing protein [Alysiella crassa]UOP06633.1 DUF333 domain-containing protein [Alysiella crassa]SSY81181.1 Putative hemolysin [Alysiella crassa]
MKKYIVLIGLLASACTITLDKIEPASPSAVFCHKQGGTAIAKRNKQGNYDSLCRLPNGKEVDEWEYYRQHHKP